MARELLGGNTQLVPVDPPIEITAQALTEGFA